MPDGPRPSRTHARSPHRVRSLVAVLILCGGLALILYAHGTAWWYAPLALPGLVLAHMAILGGGLLLAARLRHGGWGATRFPEGTGPSSRRRSMLLHSPRQFDVMSRVLTLGHERRLRQWMLDLAGLEAGDVVLDVGCGTGTLLLAARERVGPTGVLHGIEPSAEMAAHARRKAAAGRMPLEIVEGSADSLPYPGASFDAVFCTLVLHHLPPSIHEAAIREMRRVLRPGGRAAIVDWQRPESLAAAITSALSLVYLLHILGPSGRSSDLSGVERRMGGLGFEDLARRSFGGGVVGAIVGRVGPGADGAGPAADLPTHPLRY